jgi:ABC-2 type transport system permease protein
MIARKTWREIRVMVITYALILEILLIPAIWLWPNLRNEAMALGRIMPAQFLKRMFEQISSSSPEAAYRAYMAVQMFFKGVNVVGIACAVLIGTGLIARERENHTLEFLLARPVSRARVLWDKFWVSAVALVVPVLLTSWSAVPLSRAIGEDLPLGPVTLAAVHNSAFVLAFLAFTLVFSVLAKAQVHVAFAVGSVVIVEVAIYFIQEIRVASLFRLSDFDVYGPILAGNAGWAQVLGGRTIWLLAATAACYLAALRIFRRSDL